MGSVKAAPISLPLIPVPSILATKIRGKQDG